jgi:hypothetical protein
MITNAATTETAKKYNERAKNLGVFAGTTAILSSLGASVGLNLYNTIASADNAHHSNDILGDMTASNTTIANNTALINSQSRLHHDLNRDSHINGYGIIAITALPAAIAFGLSLLLTSIKAPVINATNFIGSLTILGGAGLIGKGIYDAADHDKFPQEVAYIASGLACIAAGSTAVIASHYQNHSLFSQPILNDLDSSLLERAAHDDNVQPNIFIHPTPAANNQLGTATTTTSTTYITPRPGMSMGS